MTSSNLNDYEVYDLINHEVCLEIQSSVWFSIDDLIYNSLPDAIPLRSSISDLISNPEDYMVEDLSIKAVIDKLND
jgi:hypothetical protein